MWRVQALSYLVFEFLPRYQGFQVELEDAEVKGAFIAQRSRELTFDVTGGGKRHGKRKGEVIDTITVRRRFISLGTVPSPDPAPRLQS